MRGVAPRRPWDNETRDRDLENWLMESAHWLASDALRDPATGHVLSWLNPAKPGYAYPEATAWLVYVASKWRRAGYAGPLLDAAQRYAEVLAQTVLADGLLSRSGRAYLFDSGVALAALDAWGGFACAADRLHEECLKLIQQERAVVDGPALNETDPSTRWSDAFGAHLLWLNIPLLSRGDTSNTDRLTDRLLDACVRSDGAIAIHGRTRDCYTHSCCYAIDGLMARRDQESLDAARSALDRLCAVFGGGLAHAWLDDSSSPPRLDASAQLKRLRPEYSLGFDTLASHAVGGGVPYEPGSADLNNWATAFLVEAGIALNEPLARKGP